jgi:hypothetical protein
MLGDTSLSRARDRSLNLQDHFGQILIEARE